jgi:hypothetical protein
MPRRPRARASDSRATGDSDNAEPGVRPGFAPWPGRLACGWRDSWCGGCPAGIACVPEGLPAGIKVAFSQSVRLTECRDKLIMKDCARNIRIVRRAALRRGSQHGRARLSCAVTARRASSGLPDRKDDLDCGSGAGLTCSASRSCGPAPPSPPRAESFSEGARAATGRFTSRARQTSFPAGPPGGLPSAEHGQGGRRR